jgi:hypothetical protein
MPTNLEKIRDESPRTTTMFADSAIYDAIMADLDEMIRDTLEIIAGRDIVTPDDENITKRLKGEYKALKRIRDYFETSTKG